MNGGKYCYPNSNVLKNKYNIKNKELLEKLEIQKMTVKLLGLDIRPERIKPTLDTEHLTAIHKYLFEDIYQWAGEFRSENLYKSERVLSGGSAEYADYHEIKNKLDKLFKDYKDILWSEVSDIGKEVSDFFLKLWSIHPFREGNTRTCITFLWHYLKAQNIDFHVELLRKNPMYVRDSLVMANYDEKKYLEKIISDAFINYSETKILQKNSDNTREEYQIAKSDYQAFKEKNSVKNKNYY